ncbi:MAG TPA: helix-turn-helix transcriptional regulator [Magnetospirillaceae bacterium]|jgi:transcriptional regulator with XRE-family HTH domain
MTVATRPVGDLLRVWRQRRRLSQLDLASEAEISTRHLSFLENGRATPSRDMILRLAEELEVPMRERNALLLAGGFAPVYAEREIDDPDLAAARKAIELFLERQKPYPAFAIDRHWKVVASNAALPELYEGCSDALMKRPVNGMRLTLHPEGMAPNIVNFHEWRDHMLERLRHAITVTADPALSVLLHEVMRYPVPDEDPEAHEPFPTNAVMVPFRVRTRVGVLSFFTTTTIFGTPVDVTLSELMLEHFYPADDETDVLVRRLEAER